MLRVFLACYWISQCCFTAAGAEEKEHKFVHPPVPHDYDYSDHQDFAAPDDTEKFRKLQHDLLRSYDRHMRPAKNQSRPTFIDFFLYISHIEDVNENEQTLTLHGWITMSWRDEMLDWSHADKSLPYADVSRFILPQYYMWKPDLHLYNNANLRDHIIISWNTWIHIFRNGSVIFDPPFSLTATCDFDFHDYPWDTQDCALLLGSWSYLRTQLQWRIVQGQTVEFLGSQKNKGSNWQLVQAPSAHSFDFGTDYGIWHCVQVNLKLKRNPGYLPSLILLPIFVTSTVVVFCFWIPAGGSLRLALICWMLLVEIVHFSIVASRLPPAVFSKIPFVVRFCCFNLIITLISFIISLLTHLLSNRETTRPPPEKIMQFLDSAPVRCAITSTSPSFKSSLYHHQQLMNHNDQQSEMSLDEQVSHRKLLNKDWSLLACAIDRICFLALSCVFAISWFVYVL